MTAPGSARSALTYAITRPDLYRIYPDASKLVGYAGQPDGSLDEITSAAIPRPEPAGPGGIPILGSGARPRRPPEPCQ